MARVYRREQAQRRRPRNVLRGIKLAVSGVVVLPLLGAGVVAMIHLTQLDEPRPLLRLVVVSGDSMLPTFRDGQQLLFGRRPWGEGSVVIADIPDKGVVVKRVLNEHQGWVLMTGDNQEITETYRVSEERIIGTFLMRTGLTMRTVVAAQAPETEDAER